MKQKECVRACVCQTLRGLNGSWRSPQTHMRLPCAVFVQGVLKCGIAVLVGIFDIPLNACAFEMIGSVIMAPEHAVSLGLCAVSLLEHDSL